ncbi:hypothetical protein HanIR_Chr13g0656201 [Helianthus annuus]|nr:hypothetical protein HanIR_Chr13g0656201 [Helianthus annuus]
MLPRSPQRPFLFKCVRNTRGIFHSNVAKTKSSSILLQNNTKHKQPIVSMRILRVIHDPDPEALLRITICHRSKNHLLG